MEPVERQVVSAYIPKDQAKLIAQMAEISGASRSIVTGRLIELGLRQQVKSLIAK